MNWDNIRQGISMRKGSTRKQQIVNIANWIQSCPDVTDRELKIVLRENIGLPWRQEGAVKQILEDLKPEMERLGAKYISFYLHNPSFNDGEPCVPSTDYRAMYGGDDQKSYIEEGDATMSAYFACIEDADTIEPFSGVLDWDSYGTSGFVRISINGEVDSPKDWEY